MQDKPMHIVAIRGTWSPTGNFSAYPLGAPNGSDKRVHIPASVMESAGFTNGDVVPFPLQILASVTSHTQRMVDGTLTEVEPWERITADFVTLKETDLAKVLVSSQASERRVALLVEEALKDIKVSEADLKQMQAAI